MPDSEKRVRFEDMALLTPTEYPVYRKFAGKKVKVGDKREWSIGPVCDCWSMHECSLNCCCAISLTLPYTWSKALGYAGLRSNEALLLQLAAQKELGDGGFADLTELGLDYAAIQSGIQKRDEVAMALGLERVNLDYFQRTCCAPCLQCQEIDTVYLFYKRSLGYSDIAYGRWYCCECTQFTTASPPAYDPTSTRRRVIPMPERIMRGDTPGPNYPDLTGAEFGYYFVDGVPTKNETPYVEPPSKTPPARRPLLPGFAQPSRRPK